tara:strand:+ start:896 stop:3070 length:2175 start_codon:yes stop_codon:yes gene_type:complete
MNLEEKLKSVGLKLEEYENAKKIVGRDLNDIEVGILSTVWSEHCSYKSSKIHLKRLPTTGPQVAQGPGENAGAVRLGEGWVAVFKMESHNHPSAIAPKQGAATGVGGIIRDVLSIGAPASAVLDILMFPEPQFKKTPWYLNGVVDGVGSYGNCVGVPNLGGQTSFYPGYEGNPLVNAMCVGLCKEKDMKKAVASGVGNSLVLIGAPTGRDGIHGATFASMDLDEDSGDDLPAVQVGDPFREKLLIEATSEILEKCEIVGLQDLGAGGITGSSAEMADAAGLGVIVHLDKVPQREKDMRDYDIALSESQERALICAPASSIREIIKIAEKWDLRAAEVGVVTDTKNLQMMWNSEIVCDLPISLIGMELEYDRPQKKPAPNPPLPDLKIENPDDYIAGHFEQMASNPNIASKKWVWRQYDSQVQAATVFNQGNDSGVISIPGSNLGVGMTADVKPMWCKSDPYWGAAHTIVESVCNLASKGVEALGTTNCLNFGNPENPEVMYSFSRAIDGIRKACIEMNTPITGGNVSFYNESPDGAVPPTPSIGMVGVVKNVNEILGGKLKTGDKVYVFGNDDWGLNSSEYERAVYHDAYNGIELPELNFENARKSIKKAIKFRKDVKWMSDISEGGIFDSVLRMVPKGNGINFLIPDGLRWDSFFFSETPHRFIFCADSEFDTEEAILIGEISEKEVFSFTGEGVSSEKVNFSMEFKWIRNLFEKSIEEIADL